MDKMNFIILLFVLICAVCSSQSDENLNQAVYVYRKLETNEPIELDKISNFNKNIMEYALINTSQKQNEFFQLDKFTGKLTMSSSATSATSHILQVQMKDSILAGNKNKLWKTDLVVHIRNMSFETIHQSGSFRINGITAENFIESDKSENLRDKLSNYLSDKIEMYKSCLRPTNLNLRVQIFSIVAKDDDNKTLDLRFTATVRDESVDKMLNFVDEIHFILLENQKEIEKQFKFKILAVNINKCRSEENECKSSCYNKITEIKPSNPIITTHHSFYGLNIIMESVCECQPNFDSFNNVMKNQDGPISIKHHCPIIFPNIEPCDNWSLNIFFIPKSHTGMILKFDPAEYELTHVVDDYLMLELVNFEPQLTVDFGSGRTKIKSNCTVTLLESNTITIIINQQNIELITNTKSSSCRIIRKISGNSKVLNIDTPIFIGQKYPSSLNNLALKNKPTKPQVYLLDGDITRLYINNYVTDYLTTDPEHDKNSQLNIVLISIIGVLSVISIVLLIMVIKHKIQSAPSQYFVRLRRNNSIRPLQKPSSVECYQSYTTPNNIYSDESSFYTEVQYALGSEASPGNNKNYEIMGPNNINTINKNGTYALPKK